MEFSWLNEWNAPNARRAAEFSANNSTLHSRPPRAHKRIVDQWCNMRSNWRNKLISSWNYLRRYFEVKKTIILDIISICVEENIKIIGDNFLNVVFCCYVCVWVADGDPDKHISKWEMIYIPPPFLWKQSGKLPLMFSPATIFAFGRFTPKPRISTTQLKQHYLPSSHPQLRLVTAYYRCVILAPLDCGALWRRETENSLKSW